MTTGTNIIRCSCSHEYQDVLYGKGNRVANVMRSGQSKCTVCGTIGGSKAVFTKATTEPEPVAAAAKPEKKSGRFGKDNKGKDKEKKSSRDKTPKPKIDRSRKMNKK